MTVSGEDSGEAVTLDLLDETRREVDALREIMSRASHRLDDLHRQLRNPNLIGVNLDLPFRVEHWESQAVRWTVSASASISIAHGAFEAAVKNFPNQRLYLRHGMLVIAKHEPPPPRGITYHPIKA